MPPNEWVVAARVLLKRLRDLNAGRSERPVALFMPAWLPKKKHPMIAHVTGPEPWTEETSAAWLAKNRSVSFSVGMLFVLGRLVSSSGRLRGRPARAPRATPHRRSASQAAPPALRRRRRPANITRLGPANITLGGGGNHEVF